ncbi:MAG TPA: thiamine phosphate synthase [Solirubrobacteraceae bacterium]|nr:thiamine phosphate synthase [Solirubrobacteraceae bacterium]
MVDRLTRLSEAHLYLVCPGMPDEFLHAALAGGVDIVQLREKDSSDQQVLVAARRFAAVCAEHGALLIINDRPDLAVAAGADGVHIGQDDMPVANAREIVGPERIVGLSTHTPGQIDAAGGVDYIGVGPVNETPTKPGRPAVGLELVRYAAANARVPFFAIGGIDPETVAAVRAAGAERVAVVRALVEAGDPGDVARELRQEVRVGAT